MLEMSQQFHTLPTNRGGVNSFGQPEFLVLTLPIAAVVNALYKTFPSVALELSAMNVCWILKIWISPQN